MELLSSVWNILITEDEFVTKVITAPTVILEDWLAFLLIVSIFKIHYTQKDKLVFILCLSISSIITEFFIPSPFNIFLNYIVTFTLLKLLLREKISTTFICTILPTATFAVIGILALKPILLLFHITVTQAQFTPIYKLFYLTILYILVFIIVKLFQNKDIHLFFNEDLNSKDKKIILINFILGFINLCVQLMITAFYTDVLPFAITFFSFVSLLAYFLISFYSIAKSMKLQITTRNLKTAENYNITLSILYDNVKAFQHDFNNMVFTIGGFIDTNDIEGLKKYYSSLAKDCQKVNNIALLNPTIINNPGIYNLLSAKYQKASNQNVEIQLEIFLDLNNLHMPIYDFSRMLGILIDNAIEAASSTSEKIVKILFRDSTQSRTQIIQIENSYLNKSINVNEIFKKGITEKQNHSGMGLWEVSQILKRNNNTKLITQPGEKYFCQLLEIYY